MSSIKQATGFSRVSTVLSNTALVLVVLGKGERHTSMHTCIKQAGATGRDVCEGAWQLRTDGAPSASFAFEALVRESSQASDISCSNKRGDGDMRAEAVRNAPNKRRGLNPGRRKKKKTERRIKSSTGCMMQKNFGFNPQKSIVTSKSHMSEIGNT